jgi:hypothetical protein
MHGAPISRWTMAYFAAALSFFIAALVAMGSGFGLPSASFDAPSTLAVVHLIAVGWLGLLFCGALLQFVPVLAATQLRMPWLAGPALLMLLTGLVALVAGFLGLGGHVEIEPVAMSCGGGLLATGFGCLAFSLAATLTARKAPGIPGILVLSGLAALVGTVVTGNVFAGVLSGLLDLEGLASRLHDLVPYHAASGILGWMTVTAIGVSYRLFAMFMLSPERDGLGRRVAVLAIGATAALFISFALAALGAAASGDVTIVGAALAIAVLGLYGQDVWRMLVARRRKALELNSRAGLTALGFLAAGTVLLAFAMSIDTGPHLGVAAFYLLGMGWLSGLGLAQLYKIVPFLTWLETYGPVMGRAEVPRVQDLVDERHARAWFQVYYLCVGVGALAIVFASDPVLRAASWGQCAAVAALALEYLRARRLAYAPRELRLPPGAVRPHLICAATSA